jgi:hypothetical protein
LDFGFVFVLGVVFGFGDFLWGLSGDLVFWGFFEMESYLLHSPGWPQTHDPPTSASQMLGLYTCTTMPSFHIKFYEQKK